MMKDIDAFDRLVQERRGSIVLAMELRLFFALIHHIVVQYFMIIQTTPN